MDDTSISIRNDDGISVGNSISNIGRNIKTKSQPPMIRKHKAKTTGIKILCTVIFSTGTSVFNQNKIVTAIISPIIASATIICLMGVLMILYPRKMFIATPRLVRPKQHSAMIEPLTSVPHSNIIPTTNIEAGI